MDIIPDSSLWYDPSMIASPVTMLSRNHELVSFVHTSNHADVPKSSLKEPSLIALSPPLIICEATASALSGI